MVQQVNAVLLVLGLYFSASQPLFAEGGLDASITAAPQDKAIIQEYLQKNPINDQMVKQLQVQEEKQLQQLQGLSGTDIANILKPIILRQTHMPISEMIQQMKSPSLQEKKANEQ